MRSTVCPIADVGGEPGREAVAAAAVRGRDPLDVGGAHRAEADPHRAVDVLLEDARDVGFGGTAHDVDEALDLLHRDAVPLQLLLGDRGPHEGLLAHERHRGQRLAQERRGRRRSAPRRACGSSGRSGRSNSTSSPASANTWGVVVSYWNRPVSQTSAT